MYPDYPRRSSELSPRERDLLRCLAVGLTRSETAVVLGLKPDYVASRLRRVRMKLAAKTDCHAVALAVAGGLLYPES